MAAGTFPCRIDIGEFLLEVVPSNGELSEEWNVYSIQVQRDGIVESKQQTRWQGLDNAVKQRRRSADDLIDGAASIDSLLARLSWAPCNQASLIVDFRTGAPSASTPIGYINCEVSGAQYKKVLPKTNHQIALSVLARRRVTEASRSGSGKSPMRSPKSPGGRSFVPDDGRTCTFVCHIMLDPSEVYNSPSARLEYRLQLRNQDVSRELLTAHLPGTPRYLSFSLSAARAEQRPLKILRNFHDTCVLIDQFVVDVTASGRHHLEYGFGFFPDSSQGTEKKRLTHYTRDFRKASLSDDGESRYIDFESVASASKEEDTLDASYSEKGIRNPTDVVIVSSESTIVDVDKIGRRVKAVSRFKTDAIGGLCKSSQKCSLAIALLWRDADKPLQETVMEVSTDRIDLAQDVLNQEDFPADGIVRSVAFAYGERMFFRLRKRCFEGPRHYGMPLLTPPQSPLLPVTPALNQHSGSCEKASPLLPEPQHDPPVAEETPQASADVATEEDVPTAAPQS